MTDIQKADQVEQPNSISAAQQWYKLVSGYVYLQVGILAVLLGHEF